MNLESCAALVSGGASGLGAATARALAARGAIVTVADLDEARGETLAREIGGVFAHTDVADQKSVARAVSVAATSGQALRVAVSCAGISLGRRILGKNGAPHDLASFLQVINVNLVGTFNVIRLAAAEMAKAEPLEPDGERGVIVNTASIAATDGQMGQTAYAASKGGIVGLTLPAARDMASLGIRVVSILPGTMQTALVATLPEDVQAGLASDILFPKRLGNPDEFAALVATVVELPYFNATSMRLDAGLRMPPC